VLDVYRIGMRRWFGILCAWLGSDNVGIRRFTAPTQAVYPTNIQTVANYGSIPDRILPKYLFELDGIL
jgi:hypothetical protein